jgi:nuclear pore complex protein Nup155
MLSLSLGVFIDTVTHVLLLATTHDIHLLGVSAVPNQRASNGRDITIYNTKMTVPVKSINVNVMVGSAKTGRIFFTGTGDNEVYELTYQVRISAMRVRNYN